MATRNNISDLKGEETFQGVDSVILIVDYINNMSDETQDSQDPDATKAGLKFVQDLVGSYVNILGVSKLHNSNTEQSFLVRKDSIPTNTVSGGEALSLTLRNAIRALHTSVGAGGEGKITANIASATVTFGSVASDTSSGITPEFN